MSFLHFHTIQPNGESVRMTTEPEGLVLTPLMDATDVWKAVGQCDISTRHSAEQEKPLNKALYFWLASAHIHIEQQNKQ